VILYEHPFNERVRTYLRLEHLFQRFENLLARDHATDHHFALATLFELVEVGGRADLKSDLLKDLERHKQQFGTYKGNPSVSESALQQLLSEIEVCHTGLNHSIGKINQTISGNELLTSLRNRISIPGGTCNFDLPGYHAWQQRPADQRRANIAMWSEVFTAMNDSIKLLLSLMRDTSQSKVMMATNGQFQLSLAQGKFQLMRVALDPSLSMVPEISGNRLMVSIRMMRQDEQGSLQPISEDVPFDMALCV